MLKFENERVNRINIESTHFIHPIPVAWVKPKQENEESVVFIFNGGIGTSIPSCLYLNDSVFDNHYFVTYEKAFHNDNKNKASQFKKPYLLELHEVVLWAKKEFPTKKIYLLGESWGTNINFIYYKKNIENISGVIGWNAPLAIVNPENKSLSELLAIVAKEIVTLLFNVELFLPKVQANQSKFTQNPVISRLLNFVPPVKSSTKTSLSIWRFMGCTKKFIYKYGKNPKYNFVYIQSGDDSLADWRVIRRIEKKTDIHHFWRMKTGYHVLSFEPNESIQLFDYISKFIKK